MTVISTTMRPTARAINRAFTNSSRSVASSSTIQPAPPQTATPNPSRRAARKTLRNLVELHHKSSTFLPSTSSSTISHGFEMAFRYTTPVWQEYNNDSPSTYGDLTNEQSSFLSASLARQSDRGLGGIEEFREHRPDAVGGQMGPRAPKVQPLRPALSVWLEERAWRNSDMRSRLSDREARVNEALHGTYLRGQRGTTDIGLEGVEEFAAACGEDLQSMAQKWFKRHDY